LLCKTRPKIYNTRQISSECVQCVGFWWPKTTILAKILTFGGSCTDRLLPMMAKFGVLKQTQGLHLHAKFHLNVFTVSASGDQKHNFGQILTYWGLLYRPPFADEGQIGCAISDLRCTLTCQIWSRSVYSVALCWQKKTILPFLDFGI